jgi:hypothetical protein
MRRKELQCPFCDNFLARPVDITSGTMDITGGICPCGAVYVFDRTGHNLGAAFMDALIFACKEDYDKALSLFPEEYETVEFGYNYHSNTVSMRESRTERSGKLLFLKLK